MSTVRVENIGTADVVIRSIDAETQDEELLRIAPGQSMVIRTDGRNLHILEA